MALREHLLGDPAPSGGRMRRAVGSRLAALSLRSRLVLVMLAVLLISGATVALITTLSLRHFLMSRLDQQLAAAGMRYSLSLEHPTDADGDDKGFDTVVGQQSGTLGGRVANGTVTAIGVVGAGDDYPNITDADKAAIAGLTKTTHPRTIDLPGFGPYRVSVQAGADGDLLVTGLPMTEVNEVVERLIAVELAVLTIAVVLSSIAAAICVRLSLRPLTRVAATATRVSDIPLASGEVSLPERVPNPAPGTEVGQVTTAFNHMLEHVESALASRQASERRLRRFVADASHELRTPVAVVRSHAEFAQRAGGDLPEPVTRALSRIGSESDRMGQLVDELLLLARLDAGRPLLSEPVDVTRLVIETVSDARVAGADHRWQLDLPDESVVVSGDEHTLHQALANLLANARLHTPPGTQVTATIRPLGDSVELEVADNGPGIPDEIMENLFERFVRGDTARGHANGSTGLGLAICEAIVKAHGGAITVRSKPGDTAFTVRLPSVLAQAGVATGEQWD